MTATPTGTSRASLRQIARWGFALAFESTMAGADAFTFRREKFSLHVEQHGRPCMEAPGDGTLRWNGDTFRVGGRRWLGPPDWLASDRTAFRFEWLEPPPRRTRVVEPVRVQVDDHPEELYVASRREPRWVVDAHTHVIVEAHGAERRLDRMVALLAYLWSQAHTAYERRG